MLLRTLRPALRLALVRPGFRRAPSERTEDSVAAWTAMFHWIFRIDQGVLPYGRKLLYYSYLVYCNSFNVLFRGSLAGAAKKRCKITSFIWNPQIFRDIFSTFFSEAPRLTSPRRTVCALAGPPSQKRVQSYTFLPFPPNIFPKKFTKTMFSSIYLTSVCNCQNCIPHTIFTQRPVYSIDKAKSQKSLLRRDRADKISKKIKFNRIKNKMRPR